MIFRLIFGAEEILPLDWRPYNELDAGNDAARAAELAERNERRLVNWLFRWCWHRIKTGQKTVTVNLVGNANCNVIGTFDAMPGETIRITAGRNLEDGSIKLTY